MPLQVILWSQGRTACHLLERMLSNQPKTKLLSHPFARSRPAEVNFLTEDSVQAHFPEDKRVAYTEEVEAGVAAWEGALKSAQADGNALFIHEHPQFAASPEALIDWVTNGWSASSNEDEDARNFTLIPDDILLKQGTSAIFTIRHPAKVVPAAWRAMQSIEGSNSRANILAVCTMHWQRQLYDCYIKNGISAVIAETEDYMANQEFVRKLCREAGLDPNYALFTWPLATDEEKNSLGPIVRGLMHTLLNSTGMIPSKVSPDPDLDQEQAKWKIEFGEENAGLIIQMVDASMADYEYLRARKVVI